jgi:hypothetical protein
MFATRLRVSITTAVLSLLVPMYCVSASRVQVNGNGKSRLWERVPVYTTIQEATG